MLVTSPTKLAELLASAGLNTFCSLLGNLPRATYTDRPIILRDIRVGEHAPRGTTTHMFGFMLSHSHRSQATRQSRRHAIHVHAQIWCALLCDVFSGWWCWWHDGKVDSLQLTFAVCTQYCKLFSLSLLSVSSYVLPWLKKLQLADSVGGQINL